jgi:hypothetical protein
VESFADIEGSLPEHEPPFRKPAASHRAVRFERDLRKQSSPIVDIGDAPLVTMPQGTAGKDRCVSVLLEVEGLTRHFVTRRSPFGTTACHGQGRGSAST